MQGHQSEKPSSRGTRAWLTQGPALLSISLAFGQFIGLLRTTAVARYLGTEIQGDAVIIGMITGFFGSVFTLNAAWQLVQSPRHDSPEYVASLHASTLIRGFAATLLIAAASTGILLAMGRPNLVLPMLLASTVPAIEGFLNLDAWRLIRHQEFRRLATVEVSGPVCSVASAVAILVITRSIWAIPVIAVGTSVGRAVVSHLMATRLWWPQLHRDDIREIVGFSLPLVPAGMLFWLNTQSDRLVILLSEKISWMERFDLSDLGAYGTVATIVVLPSGTIVKTMQSIVVPRVSAARDALPELKGTFASCWSPILLLCIVIAALGPLVGWPVLRWLLGAEYAPGLEVLGILIGALSVQLIRHLCYSSSTGLGTTTTILFGNCLRTSGLVLAIGAATLHLGLSGLAWSVLVAESTATLGAGYWLRHRIPGALPRVVLAVISLIGVTSLVECLR